MDAPPDHPQEKARMQALEKLQVLDTPETAAWHRLVQLASLITEAPIALISLIDRNRQWFKASIGLDVPETPRDVSFCGHTILQDEMMVVEDARKDLRFADNPLVRGAPNIALYAGAQIRSPDGYPMGTLCILDPVARPLTPNQVKALKLLADEASDLLNMRAASLEAKDAIAEAEKRLMQDLQHRDQTFAVHLTGLFLELTNINADRSDRAAIKRLRERLQSFRDDMARAEHGQTSRRPPAAPQPT